MAAVSGQGNRSGGRHLIIGPAGHVDQRAIFDAAEVGLGNPDQGFGIYRNDENVLQTDVLSMLDIEKDSWGASWRREQDTGGGSHATNDHVALGVVEHKTRGHRVEPAPDTHHAATVPERINGLLYVGELAVAIDAVTDGDSATVAFAHRRPMDAAVRESRSFDIV